MANRFLFTALKCEYYKDEHHRFDELIDIWAQKMKDLFETGFEFGGDTWKIGVLGLTGDAPFLREAGRHNRSFSNVRKSAASNRILKGVCWLCDAGRTNGPAYEDVNILTADWLGTVGPRNPLPWTSQSPLLEHLFMDQNDPARFYLPDTFHIYYFGVGKDFASSSLIYLAKTVFKKGISMPALMQSMENSSVTLLCTKQSEHTLEENFLRNYLDTNLVATIHLVAGQRVLTHRLLSNLSSGWLMKLLHPMVNGVLTL